MSDARDRERERRWKEGRELEPPGPPMLPDVERCDLCGKPLWEWLMPRASPRSLELPVKLTGHLCKVMLMRSVLFTGHVLPMEDRERIEQEWMQALGLVDDRLDSCRTPR